MYNYYYLKEYLPKRYSADIQQEQDREIVYAFKNGELSESIKKSFLDKIKEITGNSKSEWVVCFIPGSTEHKTSIRFSKLADAIRKEGYSVEQKAIFNKYDKDAGYLTGKTGNPIESFGFDGTGIVNKNILLIDDVITRGTTFNLTADKLKSLGAKNVTGLFWHTRSILITAHAMKNRIMRSQTMTLMRKKHMKGITAHMRKTLKVGVIKI